MQWRHLGAAVLAAALSIAGGCASRVVSQTAPAETEAMGPWRLVQAQVNTSGTQIDRKSPMLINTQTGETFRIVEFGGDWKWRPVTVEKTR